MKTSMKKVAFLKSLTGAVRRKSVYGVLSFLFLQACGAQISEVNDQNLVRASKSADRMIGDSEHQIHVMGSELFKGRLSEEGSLLSPSEAKKMVEKFLRFADEEEGNAVVQNVNPGLDGDEDSLVVGLPMSMLTEEHMFGAVITKVSHRESESLGRLKLSDLSPMNVKPFFFEDENENLGFILVGCVRDCNEESEDEGIISFPVVGIDESTETFYLDFSTVGEGLNLAQIMDSRETMFRTSSSKTALVDYSDNTLVFDVESHMHAVQDDSDWEEVDVTTRWYITLRDNVDPQFDVRHPTEGVGFFGTERASVERINRFPLHNSDGVAVNRKYYIKNVPIEYQASFSQAIDDWNVVFREEIGRDLFDYEFVSEEDPRNELLVPGDPRRQVIEWDLVNNAPYGGLGPNIADQKTGQIVTANVLIQGPSIVKLYTEWFGVSQEVHELEAAGESGLAQRVLEEAKRDIFAELNKKQRGRVSLSLGQLNFNIHAQNARLQDPVLSPLQFDVVPSGMSYEEYMFGYFREMLAHELGHNIGLRHNFRGNLAATGNLSRGEVSSSVMEYLGRTHRHLNMISSYDRMAIRYGYAGEAPSVLDSFCTDEDVGTLESWEDALPAGSAECSRGDAGSDPFSYFRDKLVKVSELLTNKGSEEEPVWNMEAISRQFNESLNGLILYNALASDGVQEWTNFFNSSDRPSRNVDSVESYVEEVVLNTVCDESLRQDILDTKIESSRELALENLEEFQEEALGKLRQYTGVTTELCTQ